jgi:hypothetical protein
MKLLCIDDQILLAAFADVRCRINNGGGPAVQNKVAGSATARRAPTPRQR